MQQQMEAPLDLVYCYASKDEQWREQLEMHLKPLQEQRLISPWHKEEIVPGSDQRGEIDARLRMASIILLLISSDFLNSDDCQREMHIALAYHQHSKVRVIPVIMRPCAWDMTQLKHLQCLPRNGEPITKWTNQDEAFHHIAQEIRQIVQEACQKVEQRTSSLDHMSPPLSSVQRRRRHLATRLLTIVGSLFAVAIIVLAFMIHLIPIPIQSPNLALNDSLHANDQGNDWRQDNVDSGQCFFANGTYHEKASSSRFHVCPAQAPLLDFRNFTYEVEIDILHGECGGVFFRSHEPMLYYFLICSDGSYRFIRYDNEAPLQYHRVASGTSTAIHTGLNRWNVIEVKAVGSTFALTVNQIVIATAVDMKYTNGQIGFVANGCLHPDPHDSSPVCNDGEDSTEVLFSNVAVHILWVF